MSRLDVTALRILARSIVRELKTRGYGLRHIIALASELIGLVSESIRSSRAPRQEPEQVLSPFEPQGATPIVRRSQAT
ncbi:MAG TPA: hypothetical protein VFK02_29370 [Kofleriaceae bacterium]|nr:hypothetical protein [Kofleriaceae bacterium]